jgi:hypothetical protein
MKWNVILIIHQPMYFHGCSVKQSNMCTHRGNDGTLPGQYLWPCLSE